LATIIDNPKGFKVINLSLGEANRAYGGYGICDSCNKAAINLYYIAVLNNCYCKKCYDKFCERATYYAEDAAIEKQNFEKAKKLLNI
jgi:hypothetical protein